MTDSTYDEARRCPRCEQLGVHVQKTQDRRGTIHTFKCENDRCRWFNTTWPVEVRPDGTIPQGIRRAKTFAALPDRTDEVQAAIDRQLGAELNRGSEVRR